MVSNDDSKKFEMCVSRQRQCILIVVDINVVDLNSTPAPAISVDEIPEFPSLSSYFSFVFRISSILECSVSFKRALLSE
jgi:hypothetical protein